MKKKIALIIIAAIMVTATMIGGTMAAFQASTETKNEISTSELGIQLIQEKDTQAKNAETMGGSGTDRKGVRYIGMPGDVVEEKVRVKNTKSKELYVRVTVNKSWYGADGEKNFEMDAKEIGLETDREGDWIILPGDEYGEVVYYYYKKPLKSGEETQNVIDRFTVLKDSKKESSNGIINLGSQITYEAEAIQRTAADKAMLAEWGVDAVIDQDSGIIKDINEQ